MAYVSTLAMTGGPVEGERKTRVYGKRSKNSMDDVLSVARVSTMTAKTDERKVKKK